MMQLRKLHKKLDKLHSRHGHRLLRSIYGAGCIKEPKTMFVFMNPTGKNVSAHKNWRGIRAPWLGTKNIWKLFRKLGVISEAYFRKTQKLKPSEWSPDFALKLYEELARNRVYVTNLAKCTQIDARPVKNRVFEEYLELMRKEIMLVNPRNVFTFGNQVGSILLQKSISVGDYKGLKREVLKIGGRKFSVYPVYYPVGQGMRNMSLAIKRIKAVI